MLGAPCGRVLSGWQRSCVCALSWDTHPHPMTLVLVTMRESSYQAPSLFLLIKSLSNNSAGTDEILGCVCVCVCVCAHVELYINSC